MDHPASTGASRQVPYTGYRPTEILCSCHRIPAKTVVSVVQMTRSKNVMDIMTRCGAGDGCQCCVPEIARVVEQVLGEAEGGASA